MRICKQNAAGGQAIEVGRLRLGMPAETTDPVIQVVDRNEQHVWLPAVSVASLDGDQQPEKNTEQRKQPS